MTEDKINETKPKTEWWTRRGKVVSCYKIFRIAGCPWNIDLLTSRFFFFFPPAVCVYVCVRVPCHFQSVCVWWIWIQSACLQVWQETTSSWTQTPTQVCLCVFCECGCTRQPASVSAVTTWGWKKWEKYNIIRRLADDASKATQLSTKENVQFQHQWELNRLFYWIEMCKEPLEGETCIEIRWKCWCLKQVLLVLVNACKC